MKIGYFGKLPGYGDFVQRNMSPDIIKFWDSWILQSIEVSRSQLQRVWQQRYFNSPIWRFVINKGVIRNNSLSGFMMPSVDKSGRCYPFTVICESECDVNAFSFARQMENFHEKAEDFVIGLLEKSAPDLDEINQVLVDLYSSAKDSKFQGVPMAKPASFMEIGSIADPNNNDFVTCNESFLVNLLEMQKVKVTLWWTSGGVGLTPRKRYFSGMPPVDIFSTFLLGVDS